MKRYFVLVFVFVFIVYLFGCAQKKKEEEILSMDELGAINATPATASEVKPEANTGPVVSEIPAAPAATIPPPPAATSVSATPATASASSTPSSKEIQTALKNAGYYIGEIDGKFGRITKKAIEDFQEANSLGVDGKVGPKTWAVLSKFLTVQSQPAIKPAAVKKKR